MTKLSIGSTANPLIGLRLPFALPIVVLMALGLYAIFVTGPAIRAATQANLDRALADENHAFCEKFGMRAGTSEFVACSQELTVIRTKQTERDSEANML